MADTGEVTCRPRWLRTLWCFAGLGAAGAGLAVVRVAYAGTVLDVWPAVGLLLALAGVPALHRATARVSADAYGLHCRTLPRRRSIPWSDVADLRVHLRHENNHKGTVSRRVGVLLRDGRKRLLPLPLSWMPDDPDFDAELDALRALHRRHGAPVSRHTPVISYRTAGHGWAGPLALCVLLLGCAGVAAWFVPAAAAHEQAWRSAPACTAGNPETGNGECLTTRQARIARTVEVDKLRHPSWLYFTGGRPLERLAVSQEAAQEFQPGDRVEVTFWRGTAMEVEGARYVWRENVVAPGEVAVLATALALAAGYPAARVLVRLRGRRLPDDEVLPSALPFAGALAGTALWLLPLGYLHPTNPLASPVTTTWAAVGTLATLGLLTWSWRATRVQVPGAARAQDGAGAADAPAGKETFLAARFLEHTDYNPYGFGTHVVLGGGPPAVTPHPGPGRFAAKRIPVERLTVRNVRRARGDDGGTVPRGWHVAELDDAGTPVRLAAAPADLTRIVRALDRARSSAHPENA